MIGAHETTAYVKALASNIVQEIYIHFMHDVYLLDQFIQFHSISCQKANKRLHLLICNVFALWSNVVSTAISKLAKRR